MERLPTNLLIAMRTIAEYGNYDLSAYEVSSENRINAAGERFEYYIKDAFAGTHHLKGKEMRKKAYAELFFEGDVNHPPDILLYGGDAFEIKKIRNPANNLELNSSPPRDRLYSSDPRITSECKRVDGGNWNSRDLFYAVGCIEGNVIKSIFFVHGECYAAKMEHYDKIVTNIQSMISGNLKSEGIATIEETNELGRVNDADPLKRSYLRIRPMWMLKSPYNVFSEVFRAPAGCEFCMAAIMLKRKWESFPKEDRNALLRDPRFNVKEVKVSDPNSEKNSLDAVLGIYGHYGKQAKLV